SHVSNIYLHDALPICSNISRKRKIKYAQLSKKVLPIHKYTGSSALVVLIVHASYVLYYFGWQSMNPKMLSGLLAIVVLSFVVLRSEEHTSELQSRFDI